VRLTKDEIVFVSVVLSALVIGAAVKHYRQARPPADLVPKPPAEQRSTGGSVSRESPR
jgi:hypothetical protein